MIAISRLRAGCGRSVPVACAVAGLAVGLGLAAPAWGVIIYAPNNLAGGANDNTLIRFDSTNPAGWTTIGSLGVPGIGFGGLDFSGAGNLYGYASYVQANSAPASGLYSVSTITGAATLIGDSGQQLHDLAWNPTNNTMYGINFVSSVATLYTVNLSNGATTAVGAVTGLAATNIDLGLAIDSGGNFYIHDVASDRIYKGAGLAMTSSILLSRDTDFSQGMTIDWSNGDAGYHGAIGVVPGFFSHLYGFDTNLTSWNDLGTFGVPDGTFPTVETGDLAIQPTPAPGAAALLGLGGLLLGRRRRA